MSQAVAEEMSLDVVDVKKLFDEELPLALKRHTEEARNIGATFQLNIAGAGQWFVNLTPSGPSCVPSNGEGERADCTVTVGEEDFRAVLANPKTMTVYLFLRGRLKLQGQRSTATKLYTLFSFK